MASRAKRSPPKSANGSPKRVNLALQGGGAHGAFAWGVLDGFLESGAIEIEGLSGTSAGSINAVVYAYGKYKGGNDGARQTLERFWRGVSEAGDRYNPLKAMAWDRAYPTLQFRFSPAFEMFKAATHVFCRTSSTPATSIRCAKYSRRPSISTSSGIAATRSCS